MSMTHFGLRDAQPHHRDQAVPSGDEPGFRAVPFQQGERLVDGMGSGVVNGCRCLHARPFSTSPMAPGIVTSAARVSRHRRRPGRRDARDGGSDGPARL